MILTWSELPALANQVVMVDGSFDPLHEGHISYFEAASSLGKPVLCNITSDQWTVSKHPILLPQKSRAAVIDSIRHISYVFPASVPTISVLSQLRPSHYVKGRDWLDRGGIPIEEADLCQRHSISVLYLGPTLNSSSALLDRFRR